MKARLLPLYFDPGRDADFDTELAILKTLLTDEAEFLSPVPLGSPIPVEADAVVFPQILGEAYRMVDAFRQIQVPILIVTSEFGTLSMWDWEIMSYLRSEGIDTIAPYNLDQTKKVCRALAIKRELGESKFLVFQDNPGEGFQPSIFKRFYWWEDEATQRMFEKFGISIEKKSYRELGARAMAIPDAEAEKLPQARELTAWGASQEAVNNALKLYLALRDELDADPTIKSMGINCLNESHFSNTTPCLAWSMLYEERGLIWGCEADTVSMLTKYILNKSLDAPIIMTNMYPFLLGQAALKHERIPDFPEVEEPENHILVAHCGYFGLVPKKMAATWSLKPKALAIVDEEATAIDATLPTGPMTLAKLLPSFDTISVIEGDLTGYVEYPGSDCLRGGVIKVGNGHRLLSSFTSHHYLLMTGHRLSEIELVAKVFNLNVEIL